MSYSNTQNSRPVSLDEPGVRGALYEAYRQMAKNPKSKGELKGPCPVGGGDDRFFIQPSGRFGCRRCNPGRANPEAFRKILNELSRMARLDMSAQPGTRVYSRKSYRPEPTSVQVPDPAPLREGQKFRVRTKSEEFTPIISDAPRTAVEEFHDFRSKGMADDLLMVDVTKDYLKSVVLFLPAWDYEIVQEDINNPKSRYVALRAPGRESCTLADFAIAASNIPKVMPARIRPNEWGVRLTDNQIKGLRNHRVVRVRTRKGDEWYAKVDAIVQKTDRGALLSVSDSKFTLHQQECKHFHAWTRQEQKVAHGKIARETPNEYAPTQNQRLRDPIQQLQAPTQDLLPPPTKELDRNSIQTQFTAIPQSPVPFGGQTVGLGR